MYIRHCLLYEFQPDKSVAEAQITICATYGNSFTCHRCSETLKNGYSDLSDKPCSGRPPTISDAELQELLDQDSTQIQQQFAEKLDVTQQAVSKRLHALGKIKKKRKMITS